MELKGFEEFNKMLKEIENKSPKAMETFMKAQAEELKAVAKAGTPVDTGTLKNAWQRMNGSVLNLSGTYRQIVYNLTDYGEHVEYGHRAGKNKQTMVKGRFMLRRAVDRQHKVFYKNVEKFYKGLMGK